jgi:SAM-dependent methyltransferase
MSASVSDNVSFEAYGGSAPENYERYFVAVIGAPLAIDLVDAAGLEQAERVLDLACGTGVVARRVAQRGVAVTGLDPNPGMLAAARTASPGVSAWVQAGAEAMPLADDAFDVALCQMGLQFFTDKPAALREVRRVLTGGGRFLATLPGPVPELFAVLGAALDTHVGPHAAQFVHGVFSLHDGAQLERLVRAAGFDDVVVQHDVVSLRLPQDFLWQYVHSTPLAGALAQTAVETRAAVERDVSAGWAPFARDDGFDLKLGLTTVRAG